MSFDVKSPGTLFSNPMSGLSEDRAFPISCLSIFTRANARHSCDSMGEGVALNFATHPLRLVIPSKVQAIAIVAQTAVISLQTVSMGIRTTESPTH